MARRSYSLYWSLITGLLVLIVIKVLVGVITLSAGLSIADKSVSEGTRAAAQTAADTVQLNYEYAKQLIVAGARRPGLIRFLKGNDLEGVFEVTKVIFEDTPYYKSVFVVDSDLNLISGSPPNIEHPFENIGDAEQNKFSTTDGTYVTDAYNDGTDPVVAVSARILSPSSDDSESGKVLGLLVGIIDLSIVSNNLSTLEYGEQGFAQLVSESGIILASRFPDQCGTVVSYKDRLEKLSVVPRGQFFQHTSDSGIPLNSAAIRMSSAPWWVVVTQPRQESKSKATYLKWIVSLTLVISVGTSAALGYWLFGRIVTPVRQIEDAARNLSQSNMDCRAPVGNITELSVVAEAFNEMADRLTGLLHEIEKDKEQLGKRVEERSAQLKQEMQERVSAEQQLLHSQRVESLGKLTAAVGHEINNPLSYVLTNAEILKSDVESIAVNDGISQNMKRRDGRACWRDLHRSYGNPEHRRSNSSVRPA